ncbi:hypothetical protein JCGZ_17618 [Jatropha curcas]|uniref:Uncharacterized protein n=1 Tax=Jatropha curcas TaxID=180498 RepID=A0A067K2G3_JATCU|nr:hypothetical protein JCGZ_17618 [Jatropha curcas]
MAINLFTLGAAARTAQIGLSTLLISSSKDKENRELIISNMSDMGANAIGAGINAGLYSNLRYQLLCGIDRGLVSYFEVMGITFCVGSAIRVLNAKIGAQSLGTEQKLSHLNTDEGYGNASDWFELKSVICSGFGLIDAYTNEVKSLCNNSKGKRRRSIKKKMVALS